MSKWQAEFTSDGIVGPQGPVGPQGEQGEKGDKGDKGDKGEKGDTALSVSVGTTTTGEEGTEAQVSNVGTSTDIVLNFTIPKGDKGNKGDKGDKGDTGEKGEQGIKGDKGDTGNTGAKGDKGDTGNAGFSPIANVTQAEDITTITVTDSTGTTTANIDMTDYATEGYVTDSINALYIPTKTSDLTNDSGYTTNAVANLVNYYLKTDTYNKSEINDLIGAIQTAHIEVVEQLPATGESNVIYLVQRETPEAENYYDEFIYIMNGWELIGSTQVDLTNYATKDYVNSLILTTLGGAY